MVTKGFVIQTHSDEFVFLTLDIMKKLCIIFQDFTPTKFNPLCPAFQFINKNLHSVIILLKNKKSLFSLSSNMISTVGDLWQKLASGHW